MRRTGKRVGKEPHHHLNNVAVRQIAPIIQNRSCVFHKRPCLRYGFLCHTCGNPSIYRPRVVSIGLETSDRKSFLMKNIAFATQSRSATHHVHLERSFVLHTRFTTGRRQPSSLECGATGSILDKNLDSFYKSLSKYAEFCMISSSTSCRRLSSIGLTHNHSANRFRNHGRICGQHERGNPQYLS
jgi:hypothetical protein